MKNKILELYNSKKNYYTKYIKQDLAMSEFLNTTITWTDDIKEQLYCLRNDIFEQPMCKYKGCPKPANFKGQATGYGVGCCSRKHGIAVSNLEKYGYELPFQSSKIRKIANESLQRNFGVDNPMKSKMIAKKTSETRKNYSDKQKQQYLDKRSKTNLKKYGIENPFEDTTRLKNIMIEKYGVANIAQVAEFQDKRDCAVKSKMKKYFWKSGEETHLQGYEPIVLKELEEAGYTYSEVLTKKSDMPEIWYIGEDDNKHRYYPDFYIPSENKVIEVKSEYTMLVDFHKNLLKAQSTKELGFDYKLEVR